MTNVNKIKIIHPQRDPSFVTGAYSDGIISGGFLFISGQASVDFSKSVFVLGTIEEETVRTLDNIKTIIEAAGGKMEDTVKSTVHISNIDDFDKFNAVYATYFEDCIPPARTTVQSVLGENIKVEIDVIVKLPDANGNK
ncbi:RidA family protein [Arenibacter sp. F26102]|uniref:RidA family protein n=1 Tax=Arenibacter sp. F26102 TaxID=2926416 RepID=UPI001FF21D3E|nr:RidA family protein [Arenibacter sp. F26102]MCK0148033.1 RidA family protein [Arenibacter sp. F26102]